MRLPVQVGKQVVNLAGPTSFRSTRLFLQARQPGRQDVGQPDQNRFTLSPPTPQRPDIRGIDSRLGGN